jgi:hypothetical protein
MFAVICLFLVSIVFEAVESVNRNKKFYIYEFSNYISDSWPKDYNHHRLAIDKHFRSNSGAGVVIDERNCLFYTHQYTLFTLFYERLKTSEHRTFSEEEADLFFVPYDLGMDSSTRKSDGALVQTNCPNMDEVIKLLQSSKYFSESYGANHFLVHSINQMMIYYANLKCQRLYEFCFNCSKLSIDTYPPGIFTFLDTHPAMTNNWVSIPFPSNYHYHGRCDAPPWLFDGSNRTIAAGRMEDRTPQWFATYRYRRPYSICFMGSTKVTAKKQMQLRKRLISLCRHLTQTISYFSCLVVHLSSHESSANTIQAARDTIPSQSVNSSDGKPPFPTTSNVYTMCRFCLMPGGDFPTRKGFLDAMLSGCIPVTFQRIAAQQQWPLHWGSVDAADECTVYVPMQEMMKRNASLVLKQLNTMATEDHQFIEGKLQCISKVGFRMQYSLPNAFHDQERFRNELDAFDIALGYLFMDS